MQKLFPVTGIYKHYHWGSKDALTKTLGIENTTDKPIAEIWYGAHPLSPSPVLTETGEISMGEVFTQHPELFPPRETGGRQAAPLPFMLKFLSAAEPLSLQVHPDRKSAEKGYEKEENSSIPIDSPQRNYRDRNHKPETILALTDIYALRGFRDYPEIISNLEKFCPEALKDEIEAFSRQQSKETLRILTAAILDPGENKKTPLIKETLLNAEKHAGEDRAAQWIVKLHASYPDDTAVLAPAFLNIIHLQEGYAANISPGTVHLHLEGTGIEIMNLSDNVLRGGLTEKHKDLEDFLNNADFSPTPKRYYSTDTGYVQAELPSESEDYRAEVISFESARGRILLKSGKGPSLFLALKGACTIRTMQGESHDLKPGDCIMAGGGLGFITLEGSASLVMAEVPEA